MMIFFDPPLVEIRADDHTGDIMKEQFRVQELIDVLQRKRLKCGDNNHAVDNSDLTGLTIPVTAKFTEILSVVWMTGNRKLSETAFPRLRV